MRILHAIALPDKRVQPAGASGAIYGGERSTTLLCRGLRERGHEVTLACRADANLLEHVRAAGVSAVALRGSPGTLSLVWQLARLARRGRAEILVGHSLRSCRLMHLAARIVGVPSVATMRVLDNAKNYRTSARIIAVSEGVRAHVLAQGVAPAQVVTVHNGADLTRFAPPPDGAKAKVAVEFAPDDLVVGVIARLSEEKGHDWFLQSVAPLASEFKRARFLIVGDGPLRGALEARAAQLGLGGSTRFVGYQSEVVPWLAAMDALVLPSTAKEGFARTLIEAGAMAKPCVASPVGGNDEALLDGQTGLLVPTHDVGALTQAVRQLLGDAELRRTMGEAARARVQDNFSVQSMVEKTEAVYRAVLGR